MPADPILIAGFIAHHIGKCSSDCIRLWLSGLCLWHLFNRADWPHKDPWIKSLLLSATAQGLPFKRPPRHPILLSHLQLLHDNLDFSCAKDYTIWAAALTAFWGCRRLGELLPLSQNLLFVPIVISGL